MVHEISIAPNVKFNIMNMLLIKEKFLLVQNSGKIYIKDHEKPLSPFPNEPILFVCVCVCVCVCVKERQRESESIKSIYKKLRKPEDNH